MCNFQSLPTKDRGFASAFFLNGQSWQLCFFSWVMAPPFPVRSIPSNLLSRSFLTAFLPGHFRQPSCPSIPDNRFARHPLCATLLLCAPHYSFVSHITLQQNNPGSELWRPHFPAGFLVAPPSEGLFAPSSPGGGHSVECLSTQATSRATEECLDGNDILQLPLSRSLALELPRLLVTLIHRRHTGSETGGDTR